MVIPGAQPYNYKNLFLTNNDDPVTDGVIRTSGDPEIVETLIMTRAVIGTPK